MDAQEINLLCQELSQSLAAQANPTRAKSMAAYLKSSMPFYGLQKADRTPAFKALVKAHRPSSRQDYEAVVRALWGLAHREEKYAALHYATSFKPFILPDSLPLYEELIRTGQWWDLVDWVVGSLLSPLALHFPEALDPILEQWIDDDNMWIRRAAILHALKHKEKTRLERLFSFALRRAHEREFFIRKAIGWALRACSYHFPDEVKDFLIEHQQTLSRLSFREGAKALKRQGLF